MTQESIGSTPPQVPSVGRIVHYQSRGSADGVFLPEPRAAIITAVPKTPDVIADWSIVHLAVLNPDGMYFNQFVHYSERPVPGCWSWPPRV